jgi:hypothetical protein
MFKRKTILELSRVGRVVLLSHHHTFKGSKYLYKRSKFFNVYQNLVTTSPFLSFYLVFFYHVKTHLWMIMMESKIIMV